MELFYSIFERSNPTVVFFAENPQFRIIDLFRCLSLDRRMVQLFRTDTRLLNAIFRYFGCSVSFNISFSQLLLPENAHPLKFFQRVVAKGQFLRYRQEFNWQPQFDPYDRYMYQLIKIDIGFPRETKTNRQLTLPGSAVYTGLMSIIPDSEWETLTSYQQKRLLLLIESFVPRYERLLKYFKTANAAIPNFKIFESGPFCDPSIDQIRECVPVPPEISNDIDILNQLDMARYEKIRMNAIGNKINITTMFQKLVEFEINCLFCELNISNNKLVFSFTNNKYSDYASPTYAELIRKLCKLKAFIRPLKTWKMDKFYTWMTGKWEPLYQVKRKKKLELHAGQVRLAQETAKQDPKYGKKKLALLDRVAKQMELFPEPKGRLFISPEAPVRTGHWRTINGVRQYTQLPQSKKIISFDYAGKTYPLLEKLVLSWGPLRKSGKTSNYSPWVVPHNDWLFLYADKHNFGHQYETTTPYPILMISPNGDVHPTVLYKKIDKDEWVSNILQLLNSHPVEAVDVIGKVIGKCVFCGLDLSNKDSLNRGYGSTCAKSYRLPPYENYVPRSRKKKTQPIPVENDSDTSSDSPSEEKAEITPNSPPKSDKRKKTEITTKRKRSKEEKKKLDSDDEYPERLYFLSDDDDMLPPKIDSFAPSIPDDDFVIDE